MRHAAALVDNAGSSSGYAHRGATPMEFLRMCRLDRARTELLSSRGEHPVAEIAARCGFDHLSRFSVAYRKRFGESPRDTRARARKRS